VSRIGKKPIPIKDVTVTLNNGILSIKGKHGQLEMNIHPNIKVDITKEEILVTRPDDTKQNRSLHGLTRSLINNMVKGVSEGYSKTLDIVGVGYRAELKDKAILFTIGYSHPIYFMPPEGITLEVTTPTQVIVKGSNKELVGLVAAKIRSFRKPEPYKGKGIKYSNETIIRKAGKTAGK